MTSPLISDVCQASEGVDQRKPYGRQGDNMDLPAGKTCGDCAHFRRCYLMFGHIAADEACDWAPSRFRASSPTPIEASQVHENEDKK